MNSSHLNKNVPPCKIGTLWIAVVQFLAYGFLHGVQFLSDWLLHHDDNRGRHSANYNLLPNMHLCVPVLRV